MNKSERLLTSQDAAEMLGISVSTMKRIVEAGLIEAEKTPGGHRRITSSSLEKYAKQHGLNLVGLAGKRPIVVSFPEPEQVQSASLMDSIDYWRSSLKKALIGANIEDARHVVRTVHAGVSNPAELADLLISPVMAQIGHAWQTGAIEIFQEHHACHLLTEILYDLVRQARSINRRSNSGMARPLGIGATPEGDHYTLTGILCELTLLELGWEVRNLGTHLPLIELTQAVTELRPRLAWLSVHHLQDETAFRTDFERFAETCRTLGTKAITGGLGLGERIKFDLGKLGIIFATDMSKLFAVAGAMYSHRTASYELTTSFDPGVSSTR